MFELELAIAFACLVKHLSPVFFGTGFLMLWVGVGTDLAEIIGGSVSGINHKGSFTKLGGVHVPGEGPYIFGLRGVDVELKLVGGALTDYLAMSVMIHAVFFVLAAHEALRLFFILEGMGSGPSS